MNENKNRSIGRTVLRDLVKNRYIYLMFLPVLAYYVIFCYWPMYGAVIAFKSFRPGLGIWESPWVGLKHFESFFSGRYFYRILRNTFMLSFYSLVFGFPAPIIFALLINELRHKIFKRTVQTITYIPHFISMVVICGMIIDATTSNGFISTMLSYFGFPPVNLLIKPEYFRSVYVVSGIWQGLGWGSIIYLAALTNIDSTLYEAATTDGATRFQQTIYISIPGIMPTITILLILSVGSLLSVGWEKVLLLYNPAIYETADVISTYVYRRGIVDADYSFSTAVGLFNSVVNFVLLFCANLLSRRVGETSLW